MPSVTVHDTYRNIDPAEWNAVVGEGSPFLEAEFLFALESTGCATPSRGWVPRPILARDDDGRLVAAAPAWIKRDSMGEFVYDHGWAHAAERAGLAYYPKVVVAVPFTPVTGDRLLVAPGYDRALWTSALLQGLNEVVKGSVGLHVLFNSQDEAQANEARGAFSRVQYQYHWPNRGYRTYDDFLEALRSKARKELRRERREVADLRIERVVNPSPEQMDALFDIYRSTTDKYAWGREYLTRAFFQQIGQTWGHRILGVFAWRGDTLVAGAFDAFKGDRLYGRYWGCHEDIKFLHFEVCYHQGMEFCIERGLKVFEPGHGGEHKYRRGFLPEITWSSHWFGDPRLTHGFGDFAKREAEAVRAHAAELRERAPYRTETD